MTHLRAAFIAALLLVSAAGARAEDVTLSARDGSLEISGTLLGFDGEFYRVETPFGVLTVDGSAVNCEGPGCPSLGGFVPEIAISGAREMGAVLMPALIEGFARREGYALAREALPGGEGQRFTLLEGRGGAKAAVFTLHNGTTADGFSDLVANEADLVMAVRPVSEGERALTRESGLGDLADARLVRVIARDSLVPVVAPGNPVKSISMRDLARIFSAEIRNWTEIGGEKAEITPYLAGPGTGAAEVLAGQISAGLGGALTPATRRPGDSRDVARAVAADPFGIGLVLRSDAGRNRILTLTGACGYPLGGGPESVKAGDYPLAVPLFIYRPARRLPRIGREFLSYLDSVAAQMIVRRAGLVDALPSIIGLDQQGQRLVNAIIAAGSEIGLDDLKRLARLMDGQRRLTLTFRFKGGATSMDAESKAGLRQLAQAIADGRYDGHRLTFVGFSDGQGAAAANLRLSRKRAEAVAEAVRALLETPLSATRTEIGVDAFGEALPMACDDADWGRRVNRRVEVWLK